MRFTEHEMTAALHGYVKAGLHRDAEQAEEIWRTMPKFPRFERIQMVGEVVLPIFGLLPELDVPTGTRPTFTDEQVAATLEPWLEERFHSQTIAQAESDGTDLAAADAEFRSWWDDARAAVVAEHVEFVQGVLLHLPPRTDDAQPADRAPDAVPMAGAPSEEAAGEDDLPDLPPDFVVPDHL